MSQLKRFLLFAEEDYYPKGGWLDFQGSFDTLEEAIALGERGINEQEVTSESDPSWNWFQIVDSQTGQIVARQGNGFDQEYPDLPPLNPS